MELHERNLDKNKIYSKELLSGSEESHLKIMKIASDIKSKVVQLEQEIAKNEVEEKVTKSKKSQSQLKKSKSTSCCNDSGICMNEEDQCKKKRNTKSASRKSTSNCNDGKVCPDQEVQPKKRKNTKPVLKKLNICNDQCSMDQEVQSKKIKNPVCTLRKSNSSCTDSGVCIGKKVQPKKSTNARSASKKEIKSVGVCNNNGACMNEIKPRKRKNAKDDSRKSVNVCKSAGVCMDEEVQSKKEKNTRSVSSVYDEIPDNKVKTKKKLYTSGDKITASKQVLVEVRKIINIRTSKSNADNPKKTKVSKNS